MIDRPSGKPLPGKSFDGEQSAQIADSLQEVRNELAALIAVLSQFEPVTILTADGRVVVAFAQEVGTSTVSQLGFRVLGAGTAGVPKITVEPSVITGLNESYLTPLMGGSELFADPVPELSASANSWAFLRIEIEPVAEGEEAPYFMSDDVFTVESTAVVVASDASEAVAASVDPDTGDVTNGIYLFPLARLDAAGAPSYQVIYGPIAASWCQGIVKIAPPVIVHAGPVESV